MILSNEPKCNQWLFVRYPCFAYIFKVRLQCSSAILSCFKTVSFSMYIISTEIKSKSADVLLEMTTILKELRIPQLCSEIEWTLVFSWSHCISFWLKKNVSFSFKISCILFAHRIPVTNFEAMNLKSQMFCFYILSFLIFKLMFISGRNFAYDRALRVIEDEEYLDDIDFVCAHHIFSQILNLRFFFMFF